jgi:hypothetical protein
LHPGRQQLLLSGSAASFDKSVLIGTSPNPSPAVAKSLTDTDWDPCITCTQQATAAVIRDQQQARQVSIEDLLTRAPLLRNPNRILDWDPYNACTRQATAAVIRDQQQARQVSIDWDLPQPEPRCCEIPNGYWIGTCVYSAVQPGSNSCCYQGPAASLTSQY